MPVLSVPAVGLLAVIWKHVTDKSVQYRTVRVRLRTADTERKSLMETAQRCRDEQKNPLSLVDLCLLMLKGRGY